MTCLEFNSEFVVASVSMVHSAQAEGQRVVLLPLHPLEEDTGVLRLAGWLLQFAQATKQVPHRAFRPVRNDIPCELRLSPARGAELFSGAARRLVGRARLACVAVGASLQDKLLA